MAAAILLLCYFFLPVIRTARGPTLDVLSATVHGIDCASATPSECASFCSRTAECQTAKDLKALYTCLVAIGVNCEVAVTLSQRSLLNPHSYCHSLAPAGYIVQIPITPGTSWSSPSVNIEAKLYLEDPAVYCAPSEINYIISDSNDPPSPECELSQGAPESLRSSSSAAPSARGIKLPFHNASKHFPMKQNFQLEAVGKCHGKPIRAEVLIDGVARMQGVPPPNNASRSAASQTVLLPFLLFVLWLL